MSLKVSVTITNGVITATPDPLPAGNGHNVAIKWEIENSAGWTFTSSGIVIDDDDGQFSDPHGSGQGKAYHWVDKNSNNLSYKYTINVTNGTTPLSKDPTIQNQGQSLT